MKIDSSLAHMISAEYINPYFPSLCVGGGQDKQQAGRKKLSRELGQTLEAGCAQQQNYPIINPKEL